MKMMNHHRLLPHLVLLLCCLACGPGTERQKATLPDWQALSEEMEFQLANNLLHKFYPASIDTASGGYFANFSADWQLAPKQSKIVVTQGRGLWVSSTMAQVFPEDARYARAAHHGYRFLRDHMWDSLHGGFFFSQPNGVALLHKKSYGQAFGIYGMAAYHQLTGHPEALELAWQTFLWLDGHARDPVHGGYLDLVSREGLTALDSGFSTEIVPAYGFQQAGWKDYNSSIHLLEAFTALYRQKPDSLLRTRLEEMMVLLRDTFFQEPGYLHFNFTPDWQPVTFREQGRQTVLQNVLLEHVSYGHDMETAFLLLEAAEALYGEADTITRTKAKKLMDHALEHGFDEGYRGLFEGGYYFADNALPELVISTKTWWAQAEALHTLLLFHKLYPEEGRYLQAFTGQWEFVKDCMIDHERGGWYAGPVCEEPETVHHAKGQGWKGCYHDGRALLNCVELAREMAAPSTAKR